jgi:DNA repair exonuclease SbcCD ATPase subunit
MPNEGIADISTFEVLQAAQHTKFGLPDVGVFNDYTGEEKQERIRWCENAIQDLRQRVIEFRDAFLKAHNRYGDVHGKYEDYKAFQHEAEIRIDAFKNRIEQIKDNDPEGRFAVPCFAIEQKLNEFNSQINMAVDSQTSLPIPPQSLKNAQSVFSAFNKPSM